MPGARLEDLKDPGDRYSLGDVLGSGVSGEVYKASDSQAGSKQVAIKIQRLNSDTRADLEEEYRILNELSSHPNFPDFYGAYKKHSNGCDQIWFVMQYCEGGPVTDLVRGLQKKNKRMSEEHIAYILKETVKALVHLHEHNILHRDVKGSNILLTHSGEVKLVDFGLSRVQNAEGKRSTSIGSPSWMAPEIVLAARSECLYDNRADVWAIGITAIELGDGVAPFENINPSRALFQIVRNPPPTLYRPANWSQLYNDFITECLEKNPENRPFMVELMEHPFLTQLPENDFHLSAELKSLLDSITPDVIRGRIPEIQIRKGLLIEKESTEPKILRVEDLAAIEKINEETILTELEERIKMKKCYSFIGDTLLFLNAYESNSQFFGPEYHVKYQCKSRSDNEPHIYSVADSAYQDMLHHDEPQHIVLSGETVSGKTTQFNHLVSHLLYLGLSGNKVGDKVQKAIKVIHAFGNAATSLHNNSTRHILQTQITYSSSGKVSGAIFWLYQLDKWKIIGNRNQSRANFHIFYYFYDYLATNGMLEKYKLNDGKRYRYLHMNENGDDVKSPPGPKDDSPQQNADKFNEIKSILEEMEFNEEHIQTIWSSLAAILVLGEVQFQDTNDGKAEIKNPDVATKAAQLLKLDEKKFCWALCNYCVILKGNAVKRKHTKPEAEEARHVLATGIYYRLVDWIVNVFNLKLSFSRAVFGDKYYTSVLDLFGFECYQKNGLEQLFVNTLNEQLQYYYNQRIFVREMQEQEEEEITLQPLQYYDNKPTVDELMVKPDGLMYMLDEASRSSQCSDFIIETLTNKPKGPRVRMSTAKDFCVAHYTGKVMYDTNRIAEKNRDFLPPEVIETMRMSSDSVIRLLFSNQLTKSGNLTLSSDHTVEVASGKKKRWGAALVAESDSERKYNTESKGEYSQTRRMRTAAATFRASSLEVLKSLGIGPESGSTHFVRCMRANLTNNPGSFQTEVVRHQLRALSVIDTARARQKGYSHRVKFNDFLQRYKFLAFDFDENVELTKENCRLLLVRLKLEGWVMGKTKVFLKYYNEEYLSRLYETQVKKIVKVQSMMRAFLAKRNFASKLKKFKSQDSTATEPVEPEPVKSSKIEKKSKPIKKKEDLSEDEAALIIQTQFRGFQARKQYGPMIGGGKMEMETKIFMKVYAKKWKMSSVFHVLLLYRAAKYQELVYFSQQAHLYNQNAVSAMVNSNNDSVPLNNIDKRVKASQFLGDFKPAVWKLPFRINEFPFCDSHLDPTYRVPLGDDVSWDDPFKYQAPDDYYQYYIKKNMKKPIYVREEDSNEVIDYIQTPYCRDPNVAESIYHGQPFRKYETIKMGQDRGMKGKNRAPIIHKEPTTNSGVNVKQQVNNFKDVNPGKTFVPKPPPGNFAQAQNSNNNNNVNMGNRQKLLGPKREHNPILEMETKGRRNMDSEDEPPFNFQAMLRKTNVNRASLRRSPTPEDRYNQNDTPDYGQVRQEQNNYRNNFGGYGRNDNSYNDNVIYCSKDSSDQNYSYESKNVHAPFNSNPGSSVQKSTGFKNTSQDNSCVPMQTVSAELLPGIVMHGKVAEL